MSRAPAPKAGHQVHHDSNSLEGIKKTGTLTTVNAAGGFCAVAQAGTCRRDTPGMSRWHNAACALAPDGENVDAIEGVPAA